ncbi:EF-hand domain-containing protein [Flavobacteriaceae bacterium 3-367]
MKIRSSKFVLILGLSSLMGCYTACGQSPDERKGKNKPPTVEELFAKMDANEDGQISEEECKGPLKKHFAKIDTNEDGYLSKEELEDAPRSKRPKKGPKGKQ